VGAFGGEFGRFVQLTKRPLVFAEIGMEATNRKVLDTMVSIALAHIGTLVDHVMSAPSIGDLVRDVVDTIKPYRRWNDTDSQGISVYFFGYDTIKSEFQERIVNMYVPILPLVRRFRSKDRGQKVLDLAQSVKTACRRLDETTDKREREIYMRQAESSMRNLVELAEVLFAQEL